ncbi:MAG: MarC family protein [Thermodesulfobacteriota bacterium]|nr:MarC family protein [Thermodesulfobacteriota bacterium]
MEKQNVALAPLSTPMLAGPGAITAVLVWQQRPDIPVSMPLLFIPKLSDLLRRYVLRS